MPVPTNAQLKTEILTDAAGLGYAPFVNTQTAKIESLINATTGPGAVSVFNPQIPVAIIIQNIAPADATALTTNQLLFLILLCLTGGVLDMTNANTQQLWTGFFSTMSAATKNAMIASQKRAGSRAEGLWGVGTYVSSAQIEAALHS